MSQEPAVYGAVPRVSVAGAERLWRQFSALGQAHASRAASAADESRLCFERALAYCQQIPAQRLAELRAGRTKADPHPGGGAVGMNDSPHNIGDCSAPTQAGKAPCNTR